jgi:hypothetical protein
MIKDNSKNQKRKQSELNTSRMEKRLKRSDLTLEESKSSDSAMGIKEPGVLPEHGDTSISKPDMELSHETKRNIDQRFGKESIDKSKLPKDLFDNIPKGFIISNVFVAKRERKIRTDEDTPLYLFQLSLKLPARFHPHGKQTSITHSVVAFKFDISNPELSNIGGRLDLNSLINKWIIIPDIENNIALMQHQNPHGIIPSETQFYQALSNFSTHWAQWLEENEGKIKGKDSDADENYIDELCSIAKFKRILWPDDSSFLPYLNAVTLQKRRGSITLTNIYNDTPAVEFPSSLYMKGRIRQKRRRSLATAHEQELSSCPIFDENIWSRYIVMEFSAEKIAENLVCVHDLVTNTTKSKIQRTIPENIVAEELVSSQESSQIYTTCSCMSSSDQASISNQLL